MVGLWGGGGAFLASPHPLQRCLTWHPGLSAGQPLGGGSIFISVETRETWL